MTEPDTTDGTDDVSALVDRVMRGEVIVFAPPGALAACALVPCFAIGSTAFGMGVALSVSREMWAFYSGGLASLGLLVAPIVGQTMIIFGRSAPRTWLRRYAQALLTGVLVAVGVGLMAGTRVLWPAALVSVLGLFACDRLLGSRAYLAFASFFSLKRKYREDRAAASAIVLGRRRG